MQCQGSKPSGIVTAALIVNFIVSFVLLCGFGHFLVAAQHFQHQQQFQQPQQGYQAPQQTHQASQYHQQQQQQQPPHQQQQHHAQQQQQHQQQQQATQQQASGWNSENFLKREHSLLRPYSAGGTTIPQWDFAGNTMVTNNFIRLTPDVGSMRGTLWNSVPVNMINWELQVQFQVHGAGKDLFGDGFAIWYARDRMLTGSVFGSQDYFSGLGVFADTYSNHNGEHNHDHPLLTSMLNNGTLHYDHDRDGTHTQLASCTAKFRNKNYPTFMAVRYENRRLTVSVDIDNKREWRQCFTVDNVDLPTGYFVGFSASTGDLSDHHDIVSVRMYQLDAVVDQQAVLARRGVLPFAASAEPERPHIADIKPSATAGAGRKFLTIMWYIMLILVICVILGVCGWFAYQRFGQQQKRKRFY